MMETQSKRERKTEHGGRENEREKEQKEGEGKREKHGEVGKIKGSS